MGPEEKNITQTEKSRRTLGVGNGLHQFQRQEITCLWEHPGNRVYKDKSGEGTIGRTQYQIRKVHNKYDKKSGAQCLYAEIHCPPMGCHMSRVHRLDSMFL